MSGPAPLAIATGVLLDAGLKATVVLGVPGLVALARSGSAAQRHALWTASLGALPLLLPWAAARGPEVAVDAPWVLALWAVGAAVSAGRLVQGLVGLERLRREAEPSEAPGVVLVRGIRTPLTWGLLRPVIALPMAAEAWTPSDRAMALAHERAHVERRDWAVDLATRAVAGLFWFHPLVGWARRQLAAEAEHAADDRVLASGVRPSAYAGLLLSLARPEGASLALGAASLVGRRVRALLATRSRSPRRWPALVLAGALASATLPALAAWPAWTAPPQALTCDPETSP